MPDLEPINFTRGVPAIESFPVNELAEAARSVLQESAAAILQYGPALGLASWREWIGQWQGVAPNQVLTGNGSLELAEFLCGYLLSPGDVVFVESPSYDRAITLFRRHKANLTGIPLEPDGPNIEALEAALKVQSPRFFYTIPDFQNPAGVTCSAAKRRRIVELAKRYDFLVVEDAPYRLLRYRGDEEPTLFSLAPERVLQLSSFTKLIAPGLRAGFMLGNAELLAKIAKVAEDTYISPGYLAQGIAYEWCRRGLLPPQIERLKTLYTPRLTACLEAIDRYMPESQATRPDGGFFVSLMLPEGLSNRDVRAAAAKRNLNLSDGMGFFSNGGGERFLRLPFCALTPSQIADGVRRLEDAVSEARAKTQVSTGTAITSR
ncbi:MAG TPA: PLP-dependent aminotransferase family protein [Blastocatellia bacterium]|nr:PLP-dependent aminotransferase family protein [Blastocatellia bacterium]